MRRQRLCGFTHRGIFLVVVVVEEWPFDESRSNQALDQILWHWNLGDELLMHETQRTEKCAAAEEIKRQGLNVVKG